MRHTQEIAWLKTGGTFVPGGWLNWDMKKIPAPQFKEVMRWRLHTHQWLERKASGVWEEHHLQMNLESHPTASRTPLVDLYFTGMEYGWRATGIRFAGFGVSKMVSFSMAKMEFEFGSFSLGDILDRNNVWDSILWSPSLKCGYVYTLWCTVIVCIQYEIGISGRVKKG